MNSHSTNNPFPWEDELLRETIDVRRGTDADGNIIQTIQSADHVSNTRSGGIRHQRVTHLNFLHCGHPDTQIGGRCRECGGICCGICLRQCRICHVSVCPEHWDEITIDEQVVTVCSRCKADLKRKTAAMKVWRLFSAPFRKRKEDQ